MAGHGCHGDQEPCGPINSSACGADALVLVVLVLRARLCVLVLMYENLEEHAIE